VRCFGRRKRGAGGHALEKAAAAGPEIVRHFVHQIDHTAQVRAINEEVA
jgi:hypothetical protein